MAIRHKQPKHGHIAATATILMLGGWFAAPVLAAPARDALCDSNLEATLEIRADTMSTTVAAVEDDHLLKPGVEATARKIFADSADGSETEEVIEIEADDEAPAPRLRPLSENKLVPVQRQMYLQRYLESLELRLLAAQYLGYSEVILSEKSRVRLVHNTV